VRLAAGVAMSKGPEAALYARLKENLPNAYITRLESRVGLGIPDCLIALGPLPGAFVMVELKVVKRGKKVNLSPHQIAFHHKHSTLKCPTFILVQYHPAGTTASRSAEVLLYSGAQVESLAMVGVDTPPIDRWNLAAMEWNMLRFRILEAI
jgi:hypothetical protein